MWTGSDAGVTDSSETNSVLNPTFHDVEIKLVEIINPNTTTVKFKVHADRNDNFKGLNTSHLPESASPKVPNSPFVGNENQDTKPQKNAVQFSEHVMTQKLDVEGFPLHVMNYPMESLPADMEHKVLIHPQDSQMLWNTTAKQRHKEELLHKKQQLMESFSRNSRQHSAKRRENRFYEVAPGVLVSEQPLTRNTPNPGDQDKINFNTNNGNYANRSATVPGSSKARVWTGHRSLKSGVSTVSSRWVMEEPGPPKPNHFIKMPFKQMTVFPSENQPKSQEEIFLPGDELRATTAFALSRIRHAFRRMAPPSRLDSRQGRLLKARLRPMRPVTINGARITACQGVQPENRKQKTNSPDPTLLRELKKKYLEMCSRRGQTTLQDEIKRRREAHSATSEQSIHPTSPEPIDPKSYDESFPHGQDFHDSQKSLQDDHSEQFYHNYAHQNDYQLVSHKMAALRMDSNVIF